MLYTCRIQNQTCSIQIQTQSYSSASISFIMIAAHRKLSVWLIHFEHSYGVAISGIMSSAARTRKR